MTCPTVCFNRPVDVRREKAPFLSAAEAHADDLYNDRPQWLADAHAALDAAVAARLRLAGLTPATRMLSASC